MICRSRKSGIRHAWRCLVQLCENEGMIDVSMLVKHAEKGINPQGLKSSFDLADEFPPRLFDSCFHKCQFYKSKNTIAMTSLATCTDYFFVRRATTTIFPATLKPNFRMVARLLNPAKY